MKNFSKLVIHIINLEKLLANRLVEQSSNQDPRAILTNAAHEEIRNVLVVAYQIALEEREIEEAVQQQQQRQQKVKLRLVR